MKELVLVAVLLFNVSDSATAQRNNAEAEVRAFIAAYDKAVGARDVAFLEKALPDDYILTGASGKKSTRAQVLTYYAAERAKPSYRRISLAHENVVIRAVSDMAVITNDYTLIQRLADRRPRAKPRQSDDLTSPSRLLADEYTCTCGDASVTRKTQEMEHYKNGQIMLDSVALTEQRVVAIDNNTVVETGKVRFVGIEGTKRIDVVKRYTKTWVS